MSRRCLRRVEEDKAAHIIAKKVMIARVKKHPLQVWNIIDHLYYDSGHTISKTGNSSDQKQYLFERKKLWSGDRTKRHGL